jgi:hypothetical protein
MTNMVSIEWFNFISESSRTYTNFMSNMINNWTQLQEITNIMFMKEIQKTIKENESIPN